jgi:hypothetical protein
MVPKDRPEFLTFPVLPDHQVRKESKGHQDHPE